MQITEKKIELHLIKSKHSTRNVTMVVELKFAAHRKRNPYAYNSLIVYYTDIYFIKKNPSTIAALQTLVEMT